MIAWMLYTVLVSACLLVAAHAGEWLLRLARRPVRFVWIAGALLSFVLAALARFRHATPAPAAQRVDLSTLALFESGMRTVQRSVSPSSDGYVLAFCALAALVVILGFAFVYLRLRRARQAWPTADLLGRRVRLSSDVGPVVIGVVRPEIVVPHWIVARSADEQRLILDHEASHVSARDPLVLFAGCALAALMPWNPALWLMLSRLRLAIELDCDARVLRRGGSPRAYGTLLVDVAERAQPMRLASLALADGASHLERRILAMETRRTSHPIVRGACVAAIGLAGLLAACEAKVPTAADIQRMDATSAEQAVQALGHVVPDTAKMWVVDGREMTASRAKAIPADSIATINVAGMDGPGRVRMSIMTKGYHVIADSVTYRPDGRGDAVRLTGRKPGLATAQSDQPLVILNGKRAAASVLHSLDPQRIASIEVLKGAAAVEQYGADAKNGVVTIQTKP